MKLKIIDRIKKLLQKKDIYIQNPVKVEIKNPIIKGKLVVIDDPSLEISQREELEEQERLNSLPHKDSTWNPN